MSPEPVIVYRYPNPDNTGKLTYQNKDDKTWYKYGIPYRDNNLPVKVIYNSIGKETILVYFTNGEMNYYQDDVLIRSYKTQKEVEQ
jgi:hypothetical protein